MKKHLFFTGLILALASCSNEDSLQLASNDDDQPQTIQSYTRSVDEAIAIATRAARDFGMPSSRSGAVDSSSVLAVSSRQSRSADADTALYVVNFGGDQGFAIVSANSEIEGLLAIAESGSIADADSIDNPGLKIFFDQAVTYTKTLPTIGVGNETLYRLESVCDTVTTTVGPRLAVKWGQYWPMGKFCSNGCAGCAPTAAVTALSFFETPLYLTLHYSDRDKLRDTLDWAAMKTIVAEYIDPLPVDPSNYGPEYLSLARLGREMGYQAGVRYYAKSTGLSDFRYLVYAVRAIAPDLTVSSEVSGAPDPTEVLGDGLIVMKGMSSTENGGHCWVIDGYKEQVITIKNYSIPVNPTGPIINPYLHPTSTFTRTNVYSHINWGWEGASDGYFLKDVFECANPAELDEGITETLGYVLDEDFSYFLMNQ